jgi:transglutaminase-like putative cysteine protease
MIETFERYLRPGSYVDSDHPLVVSFTLDHVRGASELERAVSLFYAVRDGVRYNPFQDFMSDESYRGSACLEHREGWCVPKAALLAACVRAAGIPARVGFADVRNHLTTPRLAEFMGSDVFIFHGYAEIYLGGRWVKATPAFNLDLCTRFHVKPLEFDGRNDSILHPFDEEDRRHMEYLGDRGSFDDVPVELIKQAFRETYPSFYRLGADATRETF